MRPWRFLERQPASKVRDPIQGEFFNTDSINSVADALVREAIQNLLDAGSGDTVSCRIYFSGSEAALSPGEASVFFDGLWPHVEACDPHAAELKDSPCRFVVIEDFETSGLVGDVHAYDEPEGENNDFYYFFRAEGRSGKSGEDRGRWGVGKYVFPMASQINTFFGLTIRDDETDELLVGQAVLKNHTLGENRYEPDGWWAQWHDEFPVPVIDSEAVDSFKSPWRISRDGGSGLSVVLPYVDEELSADSLWQSAVENYYVAIQTGQLEVLIDSPELEEPVSITKDTLNDVIGRMPSGVREGLRSIVRLVEWGGEATRDDIIEVARIPDGAAPNWSSDLIEVDDREKVRQRLADGQRVLVRVPVSVTIKEADIQEWSFFEVLLEGDGRYRDRPVFMREGIRVSEIGHGRLNGVRAVLRVEDRPLAQMLGDAEGPAHTNWSPRTEKFRGKYARGRGWLAFVKYAPGRIVAIARGEAEDADRSIAADYFSIPEPEGKKQPEGGGGDEPGDEDKPTPPEPTPRKWRVTKVSGGFSVTLTDEGKAAVSKLRVEAAYDSRRGNAFKRWAPEDFTFAKLDVVVEGAELKLPDDEEESNTFVAEIKDPDDFLVRVTGFDLNRDLNVRVRDAS